ncbi:hypothetical protein ACCO45_013101 [Purpureocillium lilacinum]|uniref:Uncharacterized protein n=1 Tax=Purpureocillium lilacinum TaxID=33203 RepID=A0ACC4DAL8_PURLI
MAGLTPAQLASFDRDGYLIIPGALRPDTVAGLLAETRRLLSSFSLADHPLTRFSTGEKSDHVGDDYFPHVRFFFEEDAFDDAGNLTKDKERAVNKIGHALHALSPPFKALLLPDGADDKDQEQAAKQQDSTFLYTDPPSAVGFWYALEDATLENGCLSFLPGSHRWAPVGKRLVRKPGDAGTEMVDNGGPRFPGASAAYVPGEVKAGDLVLIHGNLLHKSERNTSQKGRIIYTFHIIEWEGTNYDKRNWLQPPAEGFTKLYA